MDDDARTVAGVRALCGCVVLSASAASVTGDGSGIAGVTVLCGCVMLSACVVSACSGVAGTIPSGVAVAAGVPSALDVRGSQVGRMRTGAACDARAEMTLVVTRADAVAVLTTRVRRTTSTTNSTTAAPARVGAPQAAPVLILNCL